MTVTNIGTVTSNTTTASISSVTVPGGSAIFIAVTDIFASGTGSVSDGSNTYILVTSNSPNGNSGDGFTQLFAVLNAKPLSGATITYTGTGSFQIIMSACYANTNFGVIQDASVTNTAVGSGTAASVTSGAATHSGNIIIAVVGNSNPSTFTSPSLPQPPNTLSASSGFVSGGNEVNAGTSAVTFSGTFPGGGDWAALIAGFSPTTIAIFGASDALLPRKLSVVAY